MWDPVSHWSTIVYFASKIPKLLREKKTLLCVIFGWKYMLVYNGFFLIQAVLFLEKKILIRWLSAISCCLICLVVYIISSSWLLLRMESLVQFHVWIRHLQETVWLVKGTITVVHFERCPVVHQLHLLLLMSRNLAALSELNLASRHCNCFRLVQRCLEFGIFCSHHLLCLLFATWNYCMFTTMVFLFLHFQSKKLIE